MQEGRRDLQITVVVHVVDVGVLRVGREVVGDLVIPSATRGGLEGRAELGEKESLQDHPARSTHIHANMGAHVVEVIEVLPSGAPAARTRR